MVSHRSKALNNSSKDLSMWIKLKLISSEIKNMSYFSKSWKTNSKKLKILDKRYCLLKNTIWPLNLNKKIRTNSIISSRRYIFKKFAKKEKKSIDWYTII